MYDDDECRRGFLAPRRDLLSGTTIYRYVIGSMSELATNLHFLTATLLLLPLTAAGIRALYLARRSTDLAVLVGLLLSIVLMYLVAGPVVVTPHNERYAMCLTVPTCYVLAAFIDALASSAVRADALRWATAAVCAGLVASFGANYIQKLERPNTTRDKTFRTGAVDPKQRALIAVQRMREPSRTALVFVEDWWIYWTVRYLAPPETGVRVTIVNQGWDSRFPSDFNPPQFDPATMERFGIAWADRSVDQLFSGLSLAHADVRGYEPGVLLRASS